ncbi:lipopolysaccharide biosynthesis protein [Vreelandella neptunia]|uniref:Oligosaccharide flippase family protein n=1 Tax=Vreelandella neptunia TaxID=115551 RepID=A0ABS9S7C1_9GAMM|nr:oligosaccharide flippase family protein [Halomonas neptunia]
MGILKKILQKAFGGSASNVFKGMKTLAIGSGIAKIIGILAIPILTRLYSPEDFGVLAIFTAIITMLAPIITLRYVLALPLPRHDGMAFNLLIFSACLMLFTCLIVTIFLWVFGGFILPIFSMEVLIPWWWLISLGILGTVSYEMLTLWATRKRDYRAISKTNIGQSILGSFTKLLLGVLGIHPFGLLMGQLVNQSGGSGSLLKTYNNDFKKNWRHLRWSRMRKMAWVHRGFPIYRVPSQFLLIFCQQAPLFFAAIVFSSEVTGQLSLALMALVLPLSLIGGSMGKALYAESAALGIKEAAKIHEMAKDVQKKLLIVSIPAGLFLFFLGETVFTLAFGDEWIQAGQFASVLSFYIVFQFTSAPLMQLMNLLANQAAFLLINATRAVLIVLTFYLVYVFDLSPHEFVVSYSFLMSCFYIYISFYIMRSVYKAGLKSSKDLVNVEK